MHWSNEKFIAIKEQGYRYAVRSHRPGFGEIFGANTLQEIFDAPYIKKCLTENAVLVGLEVKYHSFPQRLIRASMKDGRSWVIGFFAELSDYDSDKFKNKDV